MDLEKELLRAIQLNDSTENTIRKTEAITRNFIETMKISATGDDLLLKLMNLRDSIEIKYIKNDNDCKNGIRENINIRKEIKEHRARIEELENDINKLKKLDKFKFNTDHHIYFIQISFFIIVSSIVISAPYIIILLLATAAFFIDVYKTNIENYIDKVLSEKRSGTINKENESISLEREKIEGLLKKICSNNIIVEYDTTLHVSLKEAIKVIDEYLLILHLRKECRDSLCENKEKVKTLKKF